MTTTTTLTPTTTTPMITTFTTTIFLGCDSIEINLVWDVFVSRFRSKVISND